MASDSETNGSIPAAEQWEYLYLSHRQWRHRVVAKLGYCWKLLLTPGARLRFHEDQERAIQAVLNDLGRQGWELVGVLPLVLTLFGIGGSIGSEAIFKRRVCQSESRAESIMASRKSIKVL